LSRVCKNYTWSDYIAAADPIVAAIVISSDSDAEDSTLESPECEDSQF